jgi:MtN3 and saliva related transmembrane protein
MTPNSISTIGYAAAIGTTISFLPQAIHTIRTKDTHGISLIMYLVFTTGTLLWFLYGLLSHDLPITIANAITAVFAFIILGYKFKYK